MAKRQVIEDFGGTGPVVVLLHGFVADKSYWKRLQPQLTAAGYRVISIDLLGFGAANIPHTSVEYSYDAHVAHVQIQINTLHLRTAFVLVGHSMGALLATRYAQKYPDNVRQLFLLHPPLYKNREEVRQTLRGTGKMYRFLLDSRFREFGWRVMQSIPKIPIGSHTQQSREGSMRSVIESTEFIQDLHEIRTKTLLLVGAKDRPEYIKNIPNIKTPQENMKIVVENVAHHSPLYNSRFIAQLIVENS